MNYQDNDRIDFDSVQEVYNIPDPVTQRNIDSWQSQEDRIHSGSGWYGLGDTTRQEAKNIVRDGWLLGANKVEEMTSTISLPTLESIQRKLVRGDIGDFCDPHQINRGQFSTAWTSKKRRLGTGPKRYQLCCQIGGNCYVDCEEMLWRAVACLALADAISKAGHAVEIIAFCNVADCFTSGGGQICTVKVKPFESYLDLSNLAVTLGLSGFYRIYMWKARLAHPTKNVSAGMGRSTNRLPEIQSGNATQIKIDGNITSKSDAEYFLNNIADKL